MAFATSLVLALAAAASTVAQAPSRMSVGIQAPPPASAVSAPRSNLSAVEQQRLLQIERARRGIAPPGTSIDCRHEQESKPMTDLERASWRLKCGR